MASVVGFLKSDSVSLTNGTKIVTLTGSVDCSYVVSGTAVYINNILLEGVSGTKPDVSGESTITLRDEYTGTSITGGVLQAFNTIEGLRDAIQRAKDTTDSVAQLQTSFGTLLTSSTSTVDITIDGAVNALTPYQYLVDQFGISNAQIDSLVGSVQAMTKAEFFALAEQRRHNSAGSGFNKWGRSSESWDGINEGLAAITSEQNQVRLGGYVYT